MKAEEDGGKVEKEEVEEGVKFKSRYLRVTRLALKHGKPWQQTVTSHQPRRVAIHPRIATVNLRLLAPCPTLNLESQDNSSAHYESTTAKPRGLLSIPEPTHTTSTTRPRRFPR